jgi:hypothetical protein
MRFRFAFLLIPVLLITVSAANAQEAVPNILRCTPIRAATPDEIDESDEPDKTIAIMGEVFARYEGRNHRLVLVSAATGEVVRELETSLTVPGLEVRGWSPGCRFLVAYFGVADQRDTAVWDVVENRRVGTLENSWGIVEELNWSPGGDWMVLQTLRRGGWVWHLPTNTKLQLNEQIDMRGRSFYSVEWDMARAQLLVVKIGNGNGVSVYNLLALEQIAFYHIGERSAAVEYIRLGANHDWMYVHSSNTEIVGDGNPPGMALWNRATGADYQLSFSRDMQLTAYATDVALSPDERLLVVNYSGRFAGGIGVWDLQNLADDAPYPSSHTFEIRGHHGIRFVAPDTFAMDIDEPPQSCSAHRVTRGFQAFTGEMVSEERSTESTWRCG